jgi:hypothetical protein
VRSRRDLTSCSLWSGRARGAPVIDFVLLLPFLAVGIAWSYVHRSGTFFRDDGSTDGRGG